MAAAYLAVFDELVLLGMLRGVPHGLAPAYLGHSAFRSVQRW